MKHTHKKKKRKKKREVRIKLGRVLGAIFVLFLVRTE